MNRAVTFAFAFAVLTAGGCPWLAAQSPVAKSAPAKASMNTLDDQHKLRAGDRISLRIEEDRNEPQVLPITDSGEIEAPHIGRVKAAEKTCKQLAAEIRATLESNYYHRATVLIAVETKARSRGRVQVVGAIRAEGIYDIPIDEEFTVAKAILRAGSFTEFADRARVKVIRKAEAPDGKPREFTVDVDAIWKKGQSNTDLVLEPDDIIRVPESLFRFR